MVLSFVRAYFVCFLLQFIQSMADKPIYPYSYSSISGTVFKNSVADYKINNAVFTIDDAN